MRAERLAWLAILGSPHARFKPSQRHHRGTRQGKEPVECTDHRPHSPPFCLTSGTLFQQLSTWSHSILDDADNQNQPEDRHRCKGKAALAHVERLSTIGWFRVGSIHERNGDERSEQ